MNKIRLRKSLKEWEQAYMQNNYLHGSLLVSYKGEILLNNGYGFASWEHGIQNTSETKFRIGSITKSFTALAVFQLHEQKMLNIHNTINEYLPEFPKGEQITVYQCLTHTAGITNFTNFPDFWSTTMRLPSSLEDIINSFKNEPLEFEPGKQFDYSNSGYILLTAIIERVSGMKYDEYLKEHIFLPLGMNDTGCDNGKDIITKLASGYSYNGKPVHAPYADLSFPLGAYGLYSTTGDLLIWDSAIRSFKLISEESTQIMLKANQDYYACGWYVNPVLERECYHHFGDISGYVNEMLCFKEELTIIFLCNMNVVPVKKLTRDIAKIFFEQPIELPLFLNQMNIYNMDFLCGEYQSENGQLFLCITEENGYFLSVPKDYGVLYKFGLIPISQEKNKLVFKTTMIDESLVLDYSSKDVLSLSYTDYNGKRTILFKIVQDMM
ncbi:serine hydrolase domain-containing protein [Psychrobacillus sp. FJAT-51614]|uniref:Serine hydrolase domain-containing protein n=1 Tax=Psychrobacillus mangrovi TaxID=3117745 RepID=A0ABU8F7R6_9BACI